MGPLLSQRMRFFFERPHTGRARGGDVVYVEGISFPTFMERGPRNGVKYPLVDKISSALHFPGVTFSPNLFFFLCQVLPDFSSWFEDRDCTSSLVTHTLLPRSLFTF